MTRYSVQNIVTEETSQHSSWHSAFRTACKQPVDKVVIVEWERDGERYYDNEGRYIGRFCPKYRSQW